MTFAEIAPFVPATDAVGKRQFVSRLTQAGWLVRIKNGVYQIADLTSLGPSHSHATPLLAFWSLNPMCRLKGRCNFTASMTK